MKIKSLIYIIALFIFFYPSRAQFFNNTKSEIADSTKFSIIKIKPDKIYLENDTSRFVSTTVQVLNYGNAPLRILKAFGSCYCSSVKIMNNVVYPMQVGTLILDINKDGLSQGINSVLFTIVSNSKSSPTFISVTFVDKKKKDTIPKKKK